MNESRNLKRFGLVVGALLLLALIAVIALTRTSDNAADEIEISGTNGDDAAPAVNDPEEAPAEPTATYRVVYNASWAADTHPETLPPGPHVSPIVVISHSGEDDLFASGSLATDGIEMMAETGATGVLQNEIGGQPSILDSAIGTRIDVPGSNSLEIKLDQDHSLLSAVSMLAPSPDWFVAVSNVELFQNGQWLEEVELTMGPYDAGTDSGATFTADDLDTNPAGTIGPPADNEFVRAAAEGEFATLAIVRI